MTALLALALFTAAVGWGAPRLLARADWVVRGPVTAMVLWVGLLLAFASAVAMAVHAVSEPGHLAAGPGRWLGQWLGRTVGEESVEGPAGHRKALAVGALVLAGAATVVGPAWVRAARARRRHRGLLDLVARQERSGNGRSGGWWSVEDTRAAAWCVPGRGGRVVLSRGAVELLDPAQRAAVLAHERAHLRARHHLLVGAVAALGRALPRLPLTRAAAEQVPLLAEMAADDRALRLCAPRTLAAALCVVATGPAPEAATLAAGHLGVVQRVRRLLPTRTLSPALRAACWTLALTLPAVPVLLTCGP